MMSLSSPLLKVRDLRTYFYTYSGILKAVEAVNLEIRRGEIYGLVGETGCGKSVTAQSIMRLVPSPGRIVSGEILYKSRDLLKLSEEEMRTRIRGTEIAATFQDPATFLAPSYTIGEQLEDIIKAHLDPERRKEKGLVEKKILETLRAVHLPDPERVAKQYPHELSGGMRQRAMIGMGTACKPSLFIADEATTFLDVTIGAQILRLFLDLNKTESIAMLIITHNMGIVGEICDRVSVMYAGQVVETCTAERLFNNPLHPYTVDLLQAIPSLEVSTMSLKDIPGTIPDLINPPEGCRFQPRCRMLSQACKPETPKLVEVEKDHSVACHLYAKEVDE